MPDRLKACPTKSMNLREAVEQYLELGGGYGQAVALTAFGYSREETERRFGVLDEDYHISRYFHFSDQRPVTSARREDASRQPSAVSGQQAADRSLETYQINGFSCTHVTIDAEIAEIL
ncbi:MAG: hypothetical protein HY234_02050 [Acidobacteria bacterium]|nr:hypothetical protein [Acidobacteriota bacterium]MBI3661822.1 hypothetical protein [Acidobacteriota bacterium]